MCAMPNERTNLLRERNPISERISENARNCIEIFNRSSVGAILLFCYIVIIITSAVLKGYIEEWTSMTQANVNQNLSIVTSLLISAGVFGIILSLTIIYTTDMTLFEFCLYVFVLILQLIALVYGYLQIYDGFLEKKIIIDMKNEFPGSDMLKIFQFEKDCCGIQGVKDYIELKLEIPSSCCSDKNIIAPVCSDIKLAYPVGCASTLYHNISMYIGILTYIETVLFVLQIFLGLVIIKLERS